jgi:PKD repeat protein
MRSASSTVTITVKEEIRPLSVGSLLASPSGGPGPLDVNFSIDVQEGTGDYTYLWDFGDGTSSLEAQPSHTYSEVGSYLVSVQIGDVNDNSLSASASTSVTVLAPIDLTDITATPVSGIAPLEVRFDLNPSGGSGNYLYLWDFQDETEDFSQMALQDPVHVFTEAGDYAVSVTVTDATLPEYSVEKEITVQVLPPLSIGGLMVTPNTGRAPLAVGFSVNPLGGSGNYTYGWTFGDGGTSTLQYPNHTYLASANYPVTVTVLDADLSDADDVVSVQDTLNVVVTEVVNIGEIAASPQAGIIGQELQFSSTVTGGSGNYLYAWDFADGGSSTVANPPHTFSEDNLFAVSLTVSDATDPSNADTAEVNVVIVNPGEDVPVFVCTIDSDPEAGVAPLDVSFTLTTDGGSGDYTYAWDFKDGGSSTEQNPTHTFSSGTYNVDVTVTDSNDPALSFVDSVVVNATEPVSLPGLAVSPISGLVPFTADFTLGATGGSGEYEVVWTFGDGVGSSSGLNPSYTYSTPGTYTISATVVDKNDLENLFVGDLTVQAVGPIEAVVSATPSIAIVPFDAVFAVDASGGYGDYSYQWDFGDGNSSVEQNPTHTYGVAGSYTAAVTVTDTQDGSLVTTEEIEITVKPEPIPVVIASLTATPSAGEAPLDVVFNVAAVGGDESGNYLYEWNFGDGSDLSTEQNPEHRFQSISSYTVTVTVYDATDDSQLNLATATINVEAFGGIPPIDVVTLVATPTSGEVPLTVSFNAEATGGTDSGYTYEWNFADGGTAEGQSVSHTFYDIGVHTVEVTARDFRNAESTGSAEINIMVEANEMSGSKGILTVATRLLNILTVEEEAEGLSSARKVLVGTQIDTQVDASSIDNLLLCYITYNANTMTDVCTVQRDFSRVINNAGTYVIRLEAADGVLEDYQEVWDEVTLVVSAPVPDLDILQVEMLGAVARLTGRADRPDSGILSLEVDWGDGMTENLTPGDLLVNHIYTQPGTYDIKLSAIMFPSGASNVRHISVTAE